MLKYSKLSVKHKILEFEAIGTKFTYDLMGDLESHPKEEIENTQDNTTKLHEDENVEKITMHN